LKKKERGRGKKQKEGGRERGREGGRAGHKAWLKLGILESGML